MEEQIVDDKLNLIPNESVSIFKLGDNIHKYLHIAHEYTYEEDPVVPYEGYEFFDIPVFVWVDEETHLVIKTIRCDTSCIWNDYELIGMNYSDFASIFNLSPDKKEYIWSYGPKKNDRKYTVYNFDDLGLMIWVWRSKICTVLVSKVEFDE